jgi:hypothetical protein
MTGAGKGPPPKFPPAPGAGSWAGSEQLPDCHRRLPGLPVERYLTGGGGFCLFWIVANVKGLAFFIFQNKLLGREAGVFT